MRQFFNWNNYLFAEINLLNDTSFEKLVIIFDLIKMDINEDLLIFYINLLGQAFKLDNKIEVHSLKKVQNTLVNIMELIDNFEFSKQGVQLKLMKKLLDISINIKLSRNDFCCDFYQYLSFEVKDYEELKNILFDEMQKKKMRMI